MNKTLDDLLEGWVWRSARDSQTCSFCLAMHGTITQIPRGSSVATPRVLDFPSLATHEGCRCALIARAKSYAEILGDPSLPDNRPPKDG